MITLLRKLGSLFLVLGFITVFPAISPTAAQGNARAWSHYALPVYSSPNRSDHIVGVLTPNSEAILEARNAVASWVLGHHISGSVRGWIERHRLHYMPDANVLELLISTEVMFVPSAAYSTHSYSDINLNHYPVIPTTFGQARNIFELGQARGADPHVVAKVGDCISDNRHFLSPFGWQQYTLGNYTQLQPVITQFSESLAYDSQAAYEGLVTTAVLDPAFANPLTCLPGESPLRCEYRLHHSSVAIIMFGSQDLLFTGPDQFDRNLRHIVHETIQVGVIPLLSTFPGNLAAWNRSLQYNQIVVQVALDYDIPLINLWRALETLPHHGLSPDGRHLSQPITHSGDLTQANLQKGYPMRNLVTLQALDAVWRGAMYQAP